MFNWIFKKKKRVPVVDDMGWTNTDKMRKKTRAIKKLADKYLDQIYSNGVYLKDDTVSVKIEDLFKIWDQASLIEEDTVVVEKYE